MHMRAQHKRAAACPQACSMHVLPQQGGIIAWETADADTCNTDKKEQVHRHIYIRCHLLQGARDSLLEKQQMQQRQKKVACTQALQTDSQLFAGCTGVHAPGIQGYEYINCRPGMHASGIKGHEHIHNHP
eukprot:1161886-Pelagomonas_calceolata.AAC.2